MRLTAKQATILRYLAKCENLATPTEIGEACGKPYSQASSWACSGMKALIENGLAMGGPYYSITDAGRAALTQGESE